MRLERTKAKRRKGRGRRRERFTEKHGNRDWSEGPEQGQGLEQRTGIRIGEKKWIETRTEKELERRKRK